MKTFSKEELTEKLKAGNLVLVNVLARPAFDKIRIKGSVSIPRNEMENGRWSELDRSKEIVVYCSSYDCSASEMVAEFLELKGFRVAAYEGGLKEWAEAGLPTEGTITPEQFLKERYSKTPSSADVPS